MTARALEHDLLIVACAISAGIHAALAPEHFAEGAGMGVAFAASAAVLAALTLGLTLQPAGLAGYATASIVLAGLLTAYVLTVANGLPLLHPQPERVDSLALATKAVEAVGLAAACRLAWRAAVPGPNLRPKGTLT